MGLQHELEALLFSSGRAMDEELLCSLTGAGRRQVRAALRALKKEYDLRGSALLVFQEGSAWKMLVRDQYVALVRRIVADTELSRPVLETLAVIAYQRPVLQSKVVEIRGAHAYEHIKELLELGFITKTPEGRSFLLKPTEKFFEYFDVDDGAFEKIVKEVKPEVAPASRRENTKAVTEAASEEGEERPVTPLREHRRSPEERRAEQEFLKAVEEKLRSVEARNDGHEQDALFRQREATEEAPASTGQGDAQDLKDE